MKLVKKIIIVILISCFFLSVVHHVAVLTSDSTISKTYLKPDEDSCHLVSCCKGNLGNQIWEYMSLLVVWKRFQQYGHIPYIEEDMLTNLNYIFQKLRISTSKYTNITEICNDSKGKWFIPKTDSLHRYTSWFKAKSPCKDIFLDYYSTRYEDILNVQDEVKKEMRFHPHLVQEARKKLQKLRRRFGLSKQNVTFVGMHYRGDDYVDHLSTYYNIDPEDLPTHIYYRHAMKYFKQNYQHVIFILISIDRPWLQKNLPYIIKEGNVAVNPYNDNRIRDLLLLSYCNHSIINYGTFGLTTAFFAGGTTFVYDLKLPLDHRGATVALGFADILHEWHAIT